MNTEQFPSQPNSDGYRYGPGNNQSGGQGSSPYDMPQSGNAGQYPYGAQQSSQPGAAPSPYGQPGPTPSPYSQPGEANYNSGPQGAYGFGPQGYNAYGPGQPGQPGGGDGDGGGKNRNNVIIGISVAVVLIAVAAVGIIFATNSGKGDDSETAASSSSESSSSSAPSSESSSTPSSTSSSSSSSTTKSSTYNTAGLVDSDGYFNPCKADKDTLSFLGAYQAVEVPEGRLQDNDQSGCTIYRDGRGTILAWYTLKGKPKIASNAKAPSGLPKGWLYAENEKTKGGYLYMKELSKGWAFIGTLDSAVSMSEFLENLEKILEDLGQTQN